MDDEIMWGFLAWLNHRLGSIRSNIYISFIVYYSRRDEPWDSLCISNNAKP